MKARCCLDGSSALLEALLWLTCSRRCALLPAVLQHGSLPAPGLPRAAAVTVQGVLGRRRSMQHMAMRRLQRRLTYAAWQRAS